MYFIGLFSLSCCLEEIQVKSVSQRGEIFVSDDAPEGPRQLLGRRLLVLAVADDDVAALAAETRRYALKAALLACVN